MYSGCLQINYLYILPILMKVDLLTKFFGRSPLQRLLSFQGSYVHSKNYENHSTFVIIIPLPEQ